MFVGEAVRFVISWYTVLSETSHGQGLVPVNTGACEYWSLGGLILVRTDPSVLVF